MILPYTVIVINKGLIILHKKCSLLPPCIFDILLFKLTFDLNYKIDGKDDPCHIIITLITLFFVLLYPSKILRCGKKGLFNTWLRNQIVHCTMKHKI